MMQRDVRDLSALELKEFLTGLGEPPWRVDEIRRWLYRRGAGSIDAMTSLPKKLRSSLAAAYGIFPPAVVSRAESRDGTVKLVLKLRDGSLCETVLIPEEGHRTQCLSSQSGCPLGCQFCQTGRLGFTRNLTAPEIVDQWLAGREGTGPDAHRVGNLVYMGMGEPLLNFEEVRRSVEIFTAPWGGGFAPGRITISTAGVVPAIARMGKELTGVNLAVSLNAADDRLRDLLMPINRKHPIADLMEVLRRFPRSRKPLTIEYVLLGGVNDSVEEARKLARLLRGLRCKVNLIPFNAHSGLPFQAPGEKDVDAFSVTLRHAGFAAPVRRSKGADILAACGQLGDDRS